MPAAIGFHSPLPPARTGVAGYSAALLEALRRLADVRVDTADAAIHLYHLGNNPLHREIYRLALQRPGVAVLHDAVLHHFFLGSLTREQYLDEFVYNYGEWSRGFGEQLWAGRARSGADPRYFAHPMLRRIAEASLSVVVHNPAAAAIVRRHAPLARVVEIPHLYVDTPAPHGADVERTREVLGIPPGAVVFGVFGYLRESKRLASVMRAFDGVRGRLPEAWLLIAGEFASKDLERTMVEDVHRARVARVGYTGDEHFHRLAAAVDACINLRYPGAGETSGIAIRLMGAGRPVIVTEGQETSRFPETACLRVDAGLAEAAMLSEYLVWLVRFPDARREIGRRARKYILETHAIDTVAEQYAAELTAAAERARAPYASRPASASR